MLPGPRRILYRRATTLYSGRDPGKAPWISLRDLLISLPRTISIAKAVQLLKSGSSKWIHETFQGSRTFAWQEGYGAFSVGISQSATTVKYILAQIEHHKRISFEDELKKFLSVH